MSYQATRTENQGYERKPGETAEDRFEQTLRNLRPATKKEYTEVVRKFIEDNGRDRVEFVRKPFPEGEIFVATGPFMISFDCPVSLKVIIPEELNIHSMSHHPESMRIYFSAEGKCACTGKLPVYSDMVI